MCKWASLVAQWERILLPMQETRDLSLGGSIPWRRKWQHTPVLLPGESHGQQATVHGVTKESDTTYWLNNNKCVYVAPKILIYPTLPLFPLGNHKFVFYVCESISKQLPFTVVSLKSHSADQHPVGQNLVQSSHWTPREVEKYSLSRQPWVWLNHGEFYYQEKEVG